MRKNLHLLISVIVIIPAALMYGLFPEEILPNLLEIKAFSTDLKNIFRAIMCLYLGVATIWVFGILKPSYWKFATLLTIVFMGSLSLGRALSMVIDGMPSILFLLGFLGELVLTLFSYKQLKSYPLKQ